VIVLNFVASNCASRHAIYTPLAMLCGIHIVLKCKPVSRILMAGCMCALSESYRRFTCASQYCVYTVTAVSFKTTRKSGRHTKSIAG